MNKESKTNQDTIKYFSDLTKSMFALNGVSKANTIIVKDSQFVNIDNFIETQKLSPNNQEAMHEAMYEAARKQISFDYGDMDSDEMKKAEEAIVDRFMRDYLDRMFE